METLVYSFNAVMPLLILIALGYVLKLIGVWQGRFFSELNNFCYRILLPVQLFYNVYQVGTIGEINWRVILYAVIWNPITILFGVFMARCFIREKRQRGALVQASFRSNQAIMGLPLAESLGGSAASAVASVATSVTIPLFNVSAIIVLKAYDEEGRGKSKLKGILKALITNPLIIGVVCGILCVLIRQLIPTEAGAPIFTIKDNIPALYKVIGNISGIASPVMLICLGAGLDLKLSGKLLPKIILGVSLRLLIIPALAIGLAILLRAPLNLGTAEMPMLIAYFASPVAVSSAILVKEMGGDDQYASQLVIWSSVFSMLTLFALVALLRGGGYL